MIFEKKKVKIASDFGFLMLNAKYYKRREKKSSNLSWVEGHLVALFHYLIGASIKASRVLDDVMR